ncbi:MAG TPA: hypothetical protein VMC62_12045 [Longilinea sp.]|nr:hypothetical protein [Longilinea sp.]
MDVIKRRYQAVVIAVALVAMAVSASCGGLLSEAPTTAPAPTITATATALPPTLTSTPTPYDTPTLAPSSTPFPTYTPIASLTPVPSHTPTHTWPSPTPYQSRGDLNIHTDCSVGNDTYSWMAFEAEYWHYDFIAITDYHWCPDVIQQCEKDDRILCFPGLAIAVEGSRMLLAIGIHKAIPEGLSIAETVARIHAQGGLAVAAYPYDKQFLYTRDELLNTGLDAMECPKKGDNPFADIATVIPCVYDSDAIDRLHVEPYASFVCDMKITSIEDLRGALYTGKCHR